ncbi:MAG: 50S ribosomal protein L18 [Cytophagales bacterium]
MKRSKSFKKKTFGNEERPRLSIFRSNKEVYAQIINDEVGHTLVAIDTRKLEGTLMEKSERAGKELAKMAKKNKITKVTYDRGPCAYHGVVKSFFDAFSNELANAN